ncbi:MAG: hypothetical protein Q9191_005525 [Dirinaria sp. TL-2023a]
MDAPVLVRSSRTPRKPQYGGAYHASAERPPPRSSTNIRFFNTPINQQQQILDEEQGIEKNHSRLQSGMTETGKSIEPVALRRAQILQILSTLVSQDENGRDVVALITKDGISNQDRAAVLPNQQWIHLYSEASTLDEFRAHLPDFDDDYRQLAHSVLQKVEKMCEKGFAHGRFLEPVTILGQARDPNDKSGRKLRRVSFVCMPIFSLEPSRRTMPPRDFLGHPARGLMQWRYKLDSTQNRDSKQVAAKRPLMRLLLVKRSDTNYTSGGGQDGQVDSTDSSEDSNAGSISSRRSRSTYSSSHRGYTSSSPYSSRSNTADTADPISNAEHQLHKLYEEIRNAEQQGNDELIYSLKYKLVPELEIKLIHLIKEDYDEYSTQNQTKVPVDANNVENTSILPAGYDDQDGNGETTVPHEPYGTRERYREPRIFRGSRRIFQADEDRSAPRVPNLKGIPRLEIDEKIWQRPDRRYELEPRHQGLYDDFGIEGHLKSRGRARHRMLHIGEPLEEVRYFPPRQRIIATMAELGLSEMKKPFPSFTDRFANEQVERSGLKGRAPKSGIEAAKAIMPLSYRQRSINHLSHELLQDQDDTSQPIFLWSTGLQIKPSQRLDARDPLASNEKEGAKLGKSAKDASASIDMDGEEKSQKTTLSDAFKLGMVLEQIHEDLVTIDRSFPQNIAAKLLYKHGQERQASESEAILKDQAIKLDLGTLNGNHGTAVIFHENQTRLLKTAKRILGAFVPVENRSVIVGKFWGAIYGLLRDEDHVRVENILLQLLQVLRTIRDMRAGVLRPDGEQSELLYLPRAAPIAFKSLVVLLVFAGAPSRSAYAQKQLDATFSACQRYLLESMKQLVGMVGFDKAELNFDPVYGEGLLAIMMENLQNMLSPEGATFYLTELYNEYAIKMQYSVSHKASVRVYEDIKMLRDEIEVIKSVLLKQRDVLHSFWDALYRQGSQDDIYDIPGDIYSLPSTSLPHRVVERMRLEVDRRIEDFEELLIQTDSIQNTAAQSISIKSETNDRAILIFTVVTIVFLPLSFVTGYFGMNTNDIRNMGSGQGLFWAVELPFTFLIISCALFAAYFERVKGYVARVFHRERGTQTD